MMRKKSKVLLTTTKMSLLFVLLTLSLTIMGYTYSHWENKLSISGTVTTGTWFDPCIRIRKTIEGTFTDKITGAEMSSASSEIHISDRNEPGFPNLFKLTITVKNCGDNNLFDVIVEDIIEQQVTVKNCTSEDKPFSTIHVVDIPGNNNWIVNEVTWIVGSLSAGEEADLIIWLETLPNPSDKYEPTTGDEGDSQPIPINYGAYINATMNMDEGYGLLEATTSGITLWIEDNGIEEDNIGLVSVFISDSVKKSLPYSTPWAEDDSPVLLP